MPYLVPIAVAWCMEDCRLWEDEELSGLLSSSSSSSYKDTADCFWNTTFYYQAVPQTQLFIL